MRLLELNITILQKGIHPFLDVLHTVEDGPVFNAKEMNLFHELFGLVLQLLHLVNIFFLHNMLIDKRVLSLLHAMGYKQTHHPIEFDEFVELGGDGCFRKVL